MRLLLIGLLAPALAFAAQATPEQTVAALWRAMSHDPGAGADVAALKNLFHPDAAVFGASMKDGIASLNRTAIADFLRSQETVSGKGFYECEVAREIKVYDRLAVAYSVVESRRVKGQGAPMFVGANSLQLYRSDDGWTILSLHYQLAKPGEPIPLNGGVAGKCL